MNLLDACATLAQIATRLGADVPLVALDCETTGTNPDRDRIVELAVARAALDGREAFCMRFNPGVPIPASASEVHGITDADVAHRPPFKAHAADVAALLADAIPVGFNVRAFDLRLLAAEFTRAGVTPPALRPALDAQAIFHRQEPRDLSAAVRFYCARDHEGAHGAAADVAASVDVLLAQLARYDLPATCAELADFCARRDPSWLDADGKIVWRDGEARLTFSKHAGRSLRDLVKSERGFIQWVLDKDFPADVKAIMRDALKGVFPAEPGR